MYVSNNCGEYSWITYVNSSRCCVVAINSARDTGRCGEKNKNRIRRWTGEWCPSGKSRKIHFLSRPEHLTCTAMSGSVHTYFPARFRPGYPNVDTYTHVHTLRSWVSDYPDKTAQGSIKFYKFMGISERQSICSSSFFASSSFSLFFLSAWHGEDIFLRVTGIFVSLPRIC